MSDPGKSMSDPGRSLSDPGRSLSDPGNAGLKKGFLWKKERMPAFLQSLEPEQDPLLARLRREAEEAGVPILRPETESFLRTMLKIHTPARILEIGTAVGYSALVMANALPEAHIDTIENYPPRIEAARRNIAEAGMQDSIRLLEGDAGKYLAAGLRGSSYDLVFLDAAKGQYLGWLPDILRLMAEGGILLADNVLQDMSLPESRFAIPRRERTTHARLREFLYRIKHDERLESCILPVGDGVSLSVIKQGSDLPGSPESRRKCQVLPENNSDIQDSPES